MKKTSEVPLLYRAKCDSDEKFFPVGYAWLENGVRRTWSTCESGADVAEVLARFKRAHPHLLDAWIIT